MRDAKLIFKGTFGSARKDERLVLNAKVELFKLEGEKVLFKVITGD